MSIHNTTNRITGNKANCNRKTYSFSHNIPHGFSLLFSITTYFTAIYKVLNNPDTKNPLCLNEFLKNIQVKLQV